MSQSAQRILYIVARLGYEVGIFGAFVHFNSFTVLSNQAISKIGDYIDERHQGTFMK